MSKMVKLLLSLCVLALLVSGVGAAADGRAVVRRSARMNGNFVLRMGQEVLIADQKLKIKFVSVTEDSRCPKGVDCIWAGNARVVVRLTKGTGKPIERQLDTNPREESQAETGDLSNYQIKLVSLDPYPVADKPIAAQSYAATLVVTDKN